MSDVQYQAPAESVSEVAGNYDFDDAEPAQPDTPTGDDGWVPPSREEWEQTRAMIKHYGSIVEQHAAAQQAAAEAEYLADLEYRLEMGDPSAMQELVQAQLEQHVRPLQEQVAAIEQERAVVEGEDHAFDLLAARGIEGEQAEEILEAGRDWMGAALDDFGGDTAALAQFASQETGLPPSQALDQVARWMLDHLADQRDAEAQDADATSLRDLVRRRSVLAAEPITRIRSERPDSLRDIARRYSGGA